MVQGSGENVAVFELFGAGEGGWAFRDLDISHMKVGSVVRLIYQVDLKPFRLRRPLEGKVSDLWLSFLYIPEMRSICQKRDRLTFPLSTVRGIVSRFQDIT